MNDIKINHDYTTPTYYINTDPETYNINYSDMIISDPKLNEPEHDKVNSPKHYTQHPSGVECIEITQHYNFCVGNAIKYLWRNGLKQEGGYEDSMKQIEDLKKAIWYINREIANLESGVYEQS